MFKPRCNRYHSTTTSPVSTLWIDQPKIVQNILKKYGAWNSKPKFTPALIKQLVSDRDSPADGPDGDADRAYMKDKPYRQAVGDLLWLTRVYRYDMQHAVNSLARVANNPGPKHWQALKHALQYLDHTRDFRLRYSKDGQCRVEGYADSSWAPDYGTYYDNYRSTSGAIIAAGTHAVLWHSRRQDRVAQSSSEAEYYAAASAAKNLIFVDRLMNSIRPYPRTDVPTMYMDSKSGIAAAQNAQDNEKQRHIDMRAHFLRDSVARQDITLKHVSGHSNPADTLTKSLGEQAFQKYREFYNLEPRLIECSNH